MGGYGSGRRKQHHITNECLPIDTSFLLKRGMLTGKLKQGGELRFTSSIQNMQGKVTETKHTLFCLVERYGPDASGKLSRLDADGQVTLTYGVRQGEQQKMVKQAILLVTTRPQYGGARWWMLAPCCGRRVRILYLPTFGATRDVFPECRECLELNYASQRQGYIERHKTYERYLLTNYGYTWAEMEYHTLREHYLKITPEIEHLRQRSILDMQMRMLRRLMSFTRLIMRMHLRNLRSLKSEEDRRVYLEHVVKEHGESYALDLVHMLGISAQIERDAREASSEVFDQAYNQFTDKLMQALQSEDEVPDPEWKQAVEEVALDNKMNMRYLLARKQQVEEDLKHLEAQKKAA